MGAVSVSEYVASLNEEQQRHINSFIAFMNTEYPQLTNKISFSMPMWLVGEKMYDGTPREVFRHYRELEKVGLAAPQVTYVMHDLREKGFPVSPDATTIGEAADEIMKCFEYRTGESQ